MAPSPSPETALSRPDAESLLDLADGAIVEGLLGRSPSVPPAPLLSPGLREPTGVFVTLTVGDRLNGCIGSIEGVEPLGHGAVRHAWSAAFADPRLPALEWADYEELTIEVSVLSPLVAVPAASREQVLDGVRPGVDGLVIAAGSRRGVFLPAVWDQLGDPEEFLDHLMVKAGMRPGAWSGRTRARRFTATKFARHAAAMPEPSAPASRR